MMSIFILFALLLILSALLKSPWFKGKWGEFQIALLFKLFLPKDRYTVLHNITLPTDNGTTQIDHIVVSCYGIFVVETKNLKGWIYGGEYQETWTQKIFKVSHKFQNPLRQNYKHTQTLGSLLGLDSNVIHSVVVFIGDSTFKTPMPPNVTYARGCTNYIKTKKVALLTQEQVTRICTDISRGALRKSFATDRKHVQHV
ncbi:MAG: NERD domain-containing protein, partial [Bacteroidales bacterium]|nr:NERD domain-containing protein [Bacteroidales bacterium]